MLVDIRNIDKHTININVLAEQVKLEPHIEKSYLKNNKNIYIPGFRKGKAPRNVVERYYGKTIFYADAVNSLLPELYNEIIKDKKLDPISKPNFNIKKIDDSGVEVEIFLILRPKFTLCDYKDYQFQLKELEVTDEQIQENIKHFLEENSILESKDKLIENGDTLNIDFAGYLDGNLLDDSQSSNHEIIIGSNQFIDGFEDNLINHKIGDNFEFKITFPQNYYKEELSNKDVIFRVKINDVKVKNIPEFNDEIVTQFTQFKSTEEFVNNITNYLKERNDIKCKEGFLNEVYTKILDNTEIDIPSSIIDEYIDLAIKEFEDNLSVSNFTLQQYLEFNEVTLDNIKDKMHPRAIINVKKDLIVEEIAKIESIFITNNEFAEVIKDVINNHRDTLNNNQLNELRKKMLNSKVSEYLYNFFVNRGE